MQNKKPKKQGVNISDFKKKLEAKKANKKATPTKDSLLNPNVPIVRAQKATKEAKPSSLKEDTDGKTKAPHKAKTAGIQQENQEPETDLTGLRKPSTYLVFCDWIAQPEGMRNPISQEAFCKAYNVNKNTLTQWKQRKGFWAVVEKRLKAQWREKTGLVIQALFTTVLRKGSAKEAQLFLQYINNFNPRIVIEEEAPDIQKYDPASLKQMATAMRNAGLAGVTAEHKKLEEVFNDLALSEADEDETYDNTDES